MEFGLLVEIIHRPASGQRLRQGLLGGLRSLVEHVFPHAGDDHLMLFAHSFVPHRLYRA